MTLRRIYSVRMRAVHAGRHLSGAERLVREPLLAGTVADMVERAQAKALQPDRVIVTVDTVDQESVLNIASLDVIDHRCENPETCRALASVMLRQAGISERAVAAAMEAFDRGPAPSGGNMRGAMIMDAQTGERIEQDRERGIRASRFDWSDSAGKQTARMLAHEGLTHVRTQEALALASKVANAPGMVAELCWSDDPDYVAGYAASLSLGYHRFPCLKKAGTSRGGRAFFVDRAVWRYEPFRVFLEEVPVIINVVGTVSSEDTPRGTRPLAT